MAAAWLSALHSWDFLRTSCMPTACFTCWIQLWTGALLVCAASQSSQGRGNHSRGGGADVAVVPGGAAEDGHAQVDHRQQEAHAQGAPRRHAHDPHRKAQILQARHGLSTFLYPVVCRSASAGRKLKLTAAPGTTKGTKLQSSGAQVYNPCWLRYRWESCERQAYTCRTT